MKHRKKIVVIGLLIAVSLIATGVHAQTPTPAPTSTPVSEMDPIAVVEDLGSWEFWVALLLTLVAGAVGGVVYELLILQGNLELPHKPTAEEVTEQYPYAIVKNLYDLGIWARIIIGALAAVAALLVLAPSTGFGLLATAIVAGSAGTAVFRSMQDRLSVAIAQQDAANTRAVAQQQDAKVNEALAAFAELKGKLVETASSAPGARTLTFGAGSAASLDLDDLDEVERLLSEAKGIHEVL
jgi:uncharacterized membrane protein YeaQ/YmgE (transglycosylase-associated protein family)